jgi:hypothetical protein
MPSSLLLDAPCSASGGCPSPHGAACLPPQHRACPLLFITMQQAQLSTLAPVATPPCSSPQFISRRLLVAETSLLDPASPSRVPSSLLGLRSSPPCQVMAPWCSSSLFNSSSSRPSVRAAVRRAWPVSSSPRATRLSRTRGHTCSTSPYADVPKLSVSSKRHRRPRG